MFVDGAAANDIVLKAVEVASKGDLFYPALDELPAPVYVTDAEGRLTYFNSTCVPFAGREPVIGRDSWCVTWKLYTPEGEYLPHDECPMAVAIREKRPVRGVEAIAERPDGSRVNFEPYPTPLLDENGNLLAAVNIFVDLTGRKQQQEFLHAQALRCKRLADSTTDKRAAKTLKLMADEFEADALRLERSN